MLITRSISFVRSQLYIHSLNNLIANGHTTVGTSCDLFTPKIVLVRQTHKRTLYNSQNSECDVWISRRMIILRCSLGSATGHDVVNL